jgi:NitT/TauT family transport system substrate-binding protein
MKGHLGTMAAVAAAAAALAATGCGSDSGGTAAKAGGSSGSGAKTITVGFDNALAYTNNIAVLVAQQEGFFKRQGLTVKTVAFNGGSDATKALAGGSIQVQAGVGFDAVGAQAKSIDAKVFYGIAQESDFGFLANPATGVTSLKDLAGKKAAISAFGSYTDFLTKKTAVGAGLGEDSIKEVPLGPNPTIIASISKGQTAGTWDPAGLAPLFKGKAKVIARVSDLGIPSQYSSLIATGDYIKNNGDALKRFAAAIKQAIAWHQSHQKEAVALAVKAMKLPAPVASGFYDNAKAVLTPDGAINADGLKAMADAVPALKLGPKAPAVTDIYTNDIAGGT